MKTPLLFVSSTCYDLTDVRVILHDYIERVLCLKASLSDEAGDSTFAIQEGATAIESCLANVEKSDWVIVILDRRYGPSLGRLAGAGREKLSATHLELKHAIGLKKNILVFVRTQLQMLIDQYFKIWERRPIGKQMFRNMRPRWLVSHQDLNIFGAYADAIGQNLWKQTFNDVRDIKRVLARQFGQYRRRFNTVRRIRSDRVPHLVVLLETVEVGRPYVLITVRLLNGTNYMAYETTCSLRLVDSTSGVAVQPHPMSFIAPGQREIIQLKIPHSEIKGGDVGVFIVNYYFAVGQRAQDEYRLTVDSKGNFALACAGKKFIVDQLEKLAQVPEILFEGKGP